MRAKTFRVNWSPPMIPIQKGAEQTKAHARRVMEAEQYVKQMKQTGDSVLIRFAERQLNKLKIVG